MTRIIVLGLFCLLGCGKDASSGAGEAVREEAEVRERRAEERSSSEEEGTGGVEDREGGSGEPDERGEPEALPSRDERLYFFVDGCWRWRATTREEATDACRRARRDDRWARRFCRCEADEVIEVRSSHFAFFYSRDDVWGVGETREKLEKNVRRNCQDVYGDGRCATMTAEAGLVYGPYERRRAFGEFDDPGRYRYLTESGQWIDEVGEGPCFAAGTPILTPSGERAIEEIREGELVLAMDADERIVEARVSATKRRFAEVTLRLRLSDGTEIVTTDNHPFYSAAERAFVPAGDLRVGEPLLRHIEGRVMAARVSSARVEGGQEVYSLSVDAPDTYFASGVLVHNY